MKRIFLFFSVTLALFCQEAINNEGIVKLVKSGMSEELILNVIRQRPGVYTFGATELVMLKDSGVSEKLIAAMLDKAKPEGPADATAPKPNLAATATAAPKNATVTGPGLFYKKNSEYFELITEDVDWQTKGAMKSMATVGIIKKDLNGQIAGPSSRNFLSNPMEIIISPPRGVTINSYILLPMKSEDGVRNFNVGPVNKKSGLAKGAIAFGAEKVGENAYRVVLPAQLGPGEYGILASTPNDAASTTHKMYTFRMLI